MTDPGGKRQENDSWEPGIAAMLEGMGDAVKKIVQTTGRGTSRDGNVVVVLNANGTVKEARVVDPKMPEQQRRVLERDVKEAVDSAVGVLRAQQQAIKDEIAGPLEGGRQPVDYLRMVDPGAADEAEKFLQQVREGQVPPATPRPGEAEAAPEEPEDSAGWLRRNK
ncbi:hypothetical protein Srot_2394 [Segniliparus rotundus DSM 44985]|uniref:YbaB/EbfC DNA-binding family protein n=1 Tax=Segniliparus rotundus (strain ATCC BAA-972 / CDC 1076 / CIP 108378 / DSM 44985 / JCM 13578) TaxID=640132 RepID=D6ZAV2_SEGRD|nr:YbaB/EbfC family nucleoid-associated protein [Segniliparus rotundus]ADG98838.1 hypothetical protein Srot_2394 [Segniliparus rotundus DSM 44985]